MEAEERVRANAGDPAPTIEPPTDPALGHPTDEGSDRVVDATVPNERCVHHSGRPAVARCVACGEPVCLLCAVPVRGQVLGPGCVADELGDPALLTPPDPDVAISGTAVAGALVALVGVVGPWTRTGAGDRLLGAWVADPRWSMVAAIAAVALLSVAWRSRSRGAPGSVVVGAFAGIVFVAAGLAIAFPPTFQAASWGPWVTAAGGAIAAAGAVRSGRGRTQGV